MSMPTFKVCCDKCDYEAWSLKLWGAKKYINSEGLSIPIDVTLSWCNNCRALEPVESFDNTSEYVTKLQAALNNIKANTNSVLKLLFIRLMSRLRITDKYFLDEAQEYARKIELDLKRKGTEKCLTCGSGDVDLYSGEQSIDWHLISESESDNTLVNIKHPYCGGEFYVPPDFIRIAMSAETQTFTVNGKKMELQP
tara:strand:+ start:1768 stop:2355 length:588 start_codon:yes stop_codon:yes gene_type:complete